MWKGLFLFFMSSVLLLPGTALGLTGEEIIKKVIDRETSNTTQAKIKMMLTDKKGGKRVRDIVSYYKKYGKGSKSFIRFLSPPDVKGMGFLHSEQPGKDEQFIYLPELKRVRRVAGGQRKKSFFGSDFTHQDMERREADADNHTLLKEESVDGHETYVVESTPKNLEDSQYSKVVQWIRKDNFIPIKADFYNKDGKLFKKLNVEGLEKNEDGTWTVKTTKMVNLLNEHQTVVELVEHTTNKPISDSIFTERNLAKE